MSYATRRSVMAILALGLAGLWMAVPGSAEAQSDKELFSIGRSTNRNVLKYAIKLAQRGQPDAEQPVSAYWVMHEAGGRRESLTWFEQRFAYGWEIVGPVANEGFVMKLSVFGQRHIRITRRGSDYKALVQVRDRPAFLERVFVKTKEGGAFPKVLYVELHGRDAATGKAVSERITNQ